MRISTRGWVIWTAFASTVAAAVMAPKEQEVGAVVQSTREISNRTSREKQPISNRKSRTDIVLQLGSREFDELTETAFLSSATPSQPASIQLPPEPVAPIASEPAAPPLPFRVIGRYLENGRVSVFIQYNDSMLVATTGATLNEQYRVEDISDGKITLVYLPLNERQTLSIDTNN